MIWVTLDIFGIETLNFFSKSFVFCPEPTSLMSVARETALQTTLYPDISRTPPYELRDKNDS